MFPTLSLTLRALLAVCLTGGSLAAQAPAFLTLPAGFEAVDGPQSTFWPLGAATPQRWHWVFDASSFPAAGCVEITELSVRPAFPGVDVPAWSCADLTVSMSSLRRDYRPAHYLPSFAANPLPDLVPVRWGAWSGGPIAVAPGDPAPWLPLQLQVPFRYDPSLGNDLLIEVVSCAPGGLALPIDAASGAFGTVGGTRYGDTASCTAPFWTFSHPTNEVAPIVGVHYQPVPGGCPGYIAPEWQRNDPGATLALDGVSTNDPSGPVRAERCTGELQLVEIMSTAPSLPCELVVGFLPPLAASAGAVRTAGNQVFHLDLADPNFTRVFGGFPVLLDPAGRLGLPAAWPVPVSIAAQAVLIDPVAPEGIRITAAGVLELAADGRVVLPPGDDESYAVTLGQGALCQNPGSVVHHGTSHDTLFVSTNGRVTFGAPDPSFSPQSALALAGPPSVGVWSDFLPGAGGEVRVEVVPGSHVEVRWVQVPSVGVAGAVSTFAVRFQEGTHEVVLRGLDQLAPLGVTAWAGTSAGSPIATDPGPLLLGFGGPNPPPTGGAPMLYVEGTLGSLFPAGAQEWRFSPLPGGGYEWTLL